MFRTRGPLLILISLLLAGAAAWVANGWIVSRTNATSEVKPGTVPVLAAAMDIPFGTKVEPRHVTLIQMLVGTEPPGAFHDVSSAVGKVSRAGLLKGEVLLGERFAESGEGSALASVVGQHLRAVTLRVDDVVGVAGFLLPGNRVDVVSAYKEGNQETRSETVLQNVRVLAVDQTASTNKNDPVVVRAVTVEVTPEDAEALIRARQRGSLQITLRNPLDTAIEPKAVAHEVHAPIKIGPPRPVEAVTVIRGTTVDRDVVKTGGK